MECPTRRSGATIDVLLVTGEAQRLARGRSSDFRIFLPPSLPGPAAAGPVASFDGRPRLQRRARAGFPPASRSPRPRNLRARKPPPTVRSRVTSRDARGSSTTPGHAESSGGLGWDRRIILGDPDPAHVSMSTERKAATTLTWILPAVNASSAALIGLSLAFLDEHTPQGRVVVVWLRQPGSSSSCPRTSGRPAARATR